MPVKRGLILVDTKYEFGLSPTGEVTLIDEVHTPDSSRFWLADTYEQRIAAGQEPDNFDKEFIRLYYAARGYRGEGEPFPLPPDLAVQAAVRYIRTYELLTGQPFAAAELPAGPRIEHNLRAWLAQLTAWYSLPHPVLARTFLGSHFMSSQPATVTHEPEKHRFVVVQDGETAELTYRGGTDGQIVFTHTGVPTALEGRGIASALAKTGLEYTRANNLEVVPLCSFVRGYIERKPEYQVSGAQVSRRLPPAAPEVLHDRDGNKRQTLYKRRHHGHL